MDISLNSDFDPSLLTWDDEGEGMPPPKLDNGGKTPGGGEDTAEASNSNATDRPSAGSDDDGRSSVPMTSQSGRAEGSDDGGLGNRWSMGSKQGRGAGSSISSQPQYFSRLPSFNLSTQQTSQGGGALEASHSATAFYPQFLGSQRFGSHQQTAGGSDQQVLPTLSSSMTLPQHLLLQHPLQSQSNKTVDHGDSAAAAAAAVAAFYSPNYFLPTNISGAAPQGGGEGKEPRVVAAEASVDGTGKNSTGSRTSARSGTHAEAALVSTSSGLGTIRDNSSTKTSSISSPSSYWTFSTQGEKQQNTQPLMAGTQTQSSRSSGTLSIPVQGGAPMSVMFNPLVLGGLSGHFLPSMGHMDIMGMLQHPQQVFSMQHVQSAQQSNSGHNEGNKRSGTSSTDPYAKGKHERTETASGTKQNQKDHHNDAKAAVTSNEQQQQQAEFRSTHLLFEAPIELRTNFLQSQQVMQNVPSAPDSNSRHYGMTVNGFHPMLNAQVNPIMGPSTVSGGLMPPGTSASAQPCDDGRQKNKKGGTKERNEREQKRAQKITELIESLRLSMVKGGWKVEMKSKYHTLSTCADYVKHLMKTTKEKEAAVEKAKSDLSIREHKLEEKALQESRSDPESVTSSLTASTSVSTKSNESDKERAARTVSDTSGEKKRKAGGKDSVEGDEEQIQKQPRVDAKKSTNKGSDDGVSSADSSSGEEGASGGPGVKNISLDKMSSSVSDMTDSNRSSGYGAVFTGGKSSSEKKGHKHQGQQADDEGTGASGQPASGSISSTAAVVRGGESKHRHSDVIVKHKRAETNRERKRKRGKEKTSLDDDFELDYEEVFLTSTVPQLIATPAGRIVTWNNFFLKATGLTAEEAQHLTIFSIVQGDELSSLFQIVATALRKSNVRTPTEVDTSKTISSGKTDRENDSKSSGDATVGSRFDYAAVTLPCIPFPTSKGKCCDGASHQQPPLYMTVMLMSDEDPSKRCFHCVLTDSPGTNGAIGSITPKLLARLFAEPEKKGDDGVRDKGESKKKKKKKKKRRLSESRV